MKLAEFHFHSLFSKSARALLLAVITTLLFFTGCDPTEQILEDEFEPNNEFNMAKPLSVDTTLQVNLTTQEDADYYLVSIPAEMVGIIESYDIQVDNQSDVNLNLQIYGPDKTKAGEAWYPGKSVDISFKLHTGTASFYVKVTGKDASAYPADYSLSVIPTGDADIYEPNETFDQAAPLDMESGANATLLINDADYYEVTNQETDVVDNIRIHVENLSTANLLLEVYDENRQMVGEIWYPGNSANATFYYHTNAATFYVRVTGKDAETYPCDYVLTVSHMNDADAFEPNGTIDEAALFPLDEIHDCTFLVNDDDYYKIENASSENIWDLYEVQFTNNSDINPRFRFYDNDKTELGDYEIWYPGSSANFSQRIPMKSGSSNGVYFLVNGKDGTGINGSCPYQLKVVSLHMNDDNEPDDTFAQAREITSYPSGTISGAVVTVAANDNGGDYEFYKVTLNAGKKVSFTIDPESSDTEMHFGIYDSSQAYMDGLDGGDGQTLDYYVNNSGSQSVSFFIKLGGFPGATNGNYTISFTETNAD